MLYTIEDSDSQRIMSATEMVKFEIWENENGQARFLNEAEAESFFDAVYNLYGWDGDLKFHEGAYYYYGNKLYDNEQDAKQVTEKIYGGLEKHDKD